MIDSRKKIDLLTEWSRIHGFYETMYIFLIAVKCHHWPTKKLNNILRITSFKNCWTPSLENSDRTFIATSFPSRSLPKKTRSKASLANLTTEVFFADELMFWVFSFRNWNASSSKQIERPKNPCLQINAIKDTDTSSVQTVWHVHVGIWFVQVLGIAL